MITGQWDEAAESKSLIVIPKQHRWSRILYGGKGGIKLRQTGSMVLGFVLGGVEFLKRPRQMEWNEIHFWNDSETLMNDYLEICFLPNWLSLGCSDLWRCHSCDKNRILSCSDCSNPSASAIACSRPDSAKDILPFVIGIIALRNIFTIWAMITGSWIFVIRHNKKFWSQNLFYG